MLLLAMKCNYFDKGPSKNVIDFISVQNIHFQGGGSVKINIFPHTFNFFVGFFIIFIGIFGTQKILMCTLFLGGGGFSESVWFVHS